MTPLALGAMRKAAALAFAVPGLEVDVVHDGALVARIERRFDGNDVPASTTLLSPCVFRSAVGGAVHHVEHGGSAVFLGLDATAEPTLLYSMPFTGAARPLGLIVSRVGETVLHVFATRSPRSLVDRALAEVNGALHPSLTDVPEVHASWDPVVGVTLVFCEARSCTMAVLRPYIETAMESMLVRCAVGEILDDLDAWASRSGGCA